MHLILQNGRQLPHPMVIRLFDAIDQYNNSKQREDQRPRWGLHMTEAHVIAIADTPVPPELNQETAATPKAKAKPAPKPFAGRSTSSSSAARPTEPAHGPKQPPTPPPGRGGKDKGKGSGNYSHGGGDWNYSGYGGHRW